MHRRLTAIKVARLTKQGRYGDGGGLWLQVGPNGGKSWLLRYQRAGRARQMGLGPVELVTLAEARQAAHDARRLLLAGIDPIEARSEGRQQAALEAARTISFRRCAEAYIEAYKAGWKNEKHATQWSATLKAYAYPLIGELAVASIDTTLIMKVLEPIWTPKPETASRVRGRIEAVLDWAIARHYRRGDNPARWRGHLENLLPAKSKIRPARHHEAMAYDDLPAFWTRLRSMGSISARALEFTILTAARTSETIGATWLEIDLKAKIWTVPGERIKAGRPHRVPLCPRAIQILEELPREKGNDHVFVGAKKGKGLSNMAMLQLLRGLIENGLTVHGFRSTFRDWAGDRTNFPREIAEAALAHIVKDKTEAAYRRADALEKRRKLMEAWARYCISPPHTPATVTPIGRVMDAR